MARYLVSAILLLVGTNLCTYGYTRYATTRHVLTKARATAEVFLGRYGFFPSTDTPMLATLEEKDVSAKTLIGDISLAGGMYYWWNRALPYHGIGILLIAIGILLPFVRRRTAAGKQGGGWAG